jgi:hypothetical protein
MGPHRNIGRSSRCSLLSGRISDGEQACGIRNFGGWLFAHSFGSRDQTLFHNDDIEEFSSGHVLQQAVRQAVDDTVQRPVVACVLNAIQGALDRSDPIRTRWTRPPSTPLLRCCTPTARVRRIVVLTSDHGHVVERQEQPSRQRGQGLSARWWPAVGTRRGAAAIG